MKSFTILRLVLGAALLMCAHVGPAAAQATRTWVSGVGDDANPCSRTAPCKTFAGAISKTAAGGTISVLDPGGFGGVTITKAISIQAVHGMGSVLAAATNGITVNAGSTDDVFIDGLIIDSPISGSAGLRGINFLAGKSLTLTNCAVRGFRGAPGIGINIAPSAGASKVTVSDCDVTENVVGVQVQPTGTGKANVALDRVVIDRNTGGGIIANGNKATVTMSNSTVVNNSPGLQSVNNGKIVSFGNNVINGNNPNGAPTKTVKLK